MNLVLAVVGTLGDALPAVAVGRAMRERGHAVAVIASPVFADVIARAGLEPLPFGTAADYQALVDHPDYWDPERGFGWFAKHAVLPSLRPVVALVERASRRGDTVVAAMNYAYGASHAAERLGLPTARLVTQPAMLDALSAGMPGRFARVVGSLETLLDHRGRTLGATEARAPRRRALVALFPAWFLPPGVAAPAGTVLTGFPAFDGEADASLPPAVTTFLAAGPAPVVVFGGSNGTRAREMLRTGLAACERLGRRAVVVARDPALASEVAGRAALVVPYAPFGLWLGRAAAVLHHGGIGTIARSLAAGVPQLALTANFETPENAAAMTALGVGDALPVGRATVEAVGDRLAALLGSDAVLRRCDAVAARMRADNPFERVSTVLEGLLAGAPPRA